MLQNRQEHNVRLFGELDRFQQLFDVEIGVMGLVGSLKPV